ncbi:MAG TPA: FkbM family methyltransferase [Ohtaekwangia sp.]|nr:FkbM family methyltransferase [Ohtaekwangia sp.]
MGRGYQYFEKLTFKTRFFNLFRSLFQNLPFEKFLISKTYGKDPASFWAKLVPPEYLYEKNSCRSAIINGVKYKLDISDTVDHFIYFGFSDKAFDSIKSHVKKDSIIVDVGANMGRFTLDFAFAARDGQIISYEPDPRSFEKLMCNIALNDFQHIKTFKKALGNALCVRELFKVNHHNAGMNRFVSGKIADGIDSIETKVSVLDEEVKILGVTHIDIIKIDVEGFEHKVLQGAEESIKKYRPILFLELVDENLKDHGDTPGDVIKWLRERKYSIFRASNMKVVDETSDLSKCHFDVLCLPERN